MRCLNLAAVCFTTLLSWPCADAHSLGAFSFPWVLPLIEKNVTHVTICGNGNIQPNKKSLGRDFLLGPQSTGYLFSDLLNNDEYWKVLREQNLTAARDTLKARFDKATLWKISKDGTASSLGSPSEVDLVFTSTVRDCIEGAKTTLGNDCSKAPPNWNCCSEKFAGPKITWRLPEGDFVLLYSPDPSVRLKVPQEANHRFCNVVDPIELGDPVEVTLLPPDPQAKQTVLLDYRVFAANRDGSYRVVKEILNSSFGNCSRCTGGVSLHCSKKGDSRDSNCSNDLAGGFGIRVYETNGKHTLRQKNATKLRFSVPGVSTQEEIVLNPENPLVVNLSTQNAPETAIYKIEFLLHQKK